MYYVQMSLPEITEYCASLNDKERIAMQAAQECLGSSFNIENSNGFKAWKQTCLQTLNNSKNVSIPSITPIPKALPP